MSPELISLSLAFVGFSLFGAIAYKTFFTKDALLLEHKAGELGREARGLEAKLERAFSPRPSSLTNDAGEPVSLEKALLDARLHNTTAAFYGEDRHLLAVLIPSRDFRSRESLQAWYENVSGSITGVEQ